MGLHGKAKEFSIAAGIAALLVAAYRIFQLFELINLFNESGLDLPITVLIGPIAIIVAMILCAAYALVFYDKKQSPVLGISAAVLAGLHIYICINNALSVINGFGTNLTVLNMIRNMLISVIFIAISLKYLTNIVKININALPIIAIAIAVISTIAASVVGNFPLTMRNVLMGSLHFVPYIMLALFCPQTREADNVPPVGEPVNTVVIVQQTTGSAVGICALIFAILGLFIFAILFVPLALILSITAIIKKQYLLGVCALVITFGAAFISPTIWLILMGFAMMR